MTTAGASVEYAAEARALVELLILQLHRAEPFAKAQKTALEKFLADNPTTKPLLPYLLAEVDLAGDRISDAAKGALVKSSQSAATTQCDLPDPAIGPIDWTRLPAHSWLLTVPFELERPLFSRDEYLLGSNDNPMRRERATAQPYYAASSWKGVLREAMRWIDIGQPDPTSLLFGPPAETAELHRGRLQFFATYFSKTRPYVTHALKRITKTGTVPVNYTMVKEGEAGTLHVLYVPLWGPPGEPAVTDAESLYHAKLVRQAAAVALVQTGFGGKTSSGFGLAKIVAPNPATLTGHMLAQTFSSIDELGCQ